MATVGIKAIFQKLFRPTKIATTDQASIQAAKVKTSASIAPRRPPIRQSIGGVRFVVPPSRAFAVTNNPGGGGPGNAGAAPAQSFALKTAPDVQPSWHYESRFEYTGHARPSVTPVTAGIRANDFRNLGDSFGGRA